MRRLTLMIALTADIFCEVYLLRTVMPISAERHAPHKQRQMSRFAAAVNGNSMTEVLLFTRQVTEVKSLLSRHTDEPLPDLPAFEVHPNRFIAPKHFSDSTHKITLLKFIPQEHKKATPSSRQDRCTSLFRPIVQALAPCVSAGCCTVIGLVPRVLFMVTIS